MVARKMPSSRSGSGFPSTVKVSGLKSNVHGSGPAFVGQVFSMCDLSGTGLMAVSTHFDIPFISKRTPDWLKKMFAAATKSERNGPVFRFFMDLGDAVSYVKHLNIPSGVVGACRLDLAFEHFKEKPHMFQFVPNEKQVKEANKLLKANPQLGRNKKVEGVPVFSAQNLDIAIKTSEGIKWYTPYFFDKNMLDNILEESVDQHFHSMIQTRNMRRRRDVIDDSLTAEALEEMGDSLWEPPEVQEVMDEVGHPSIPLSVISKAAEIQLLYTVDKVLLGNRWLRKVTGIQPKFPYVVDSFEKRSAAAFSRARETSNLAEDSAFGSDNTAPHCLGSSIEERRDCNNADQRHEKVDKQHSSKNWLALPWSKPQQNVPIIPDESRQSEIRESGTQELLQSPLLPKITMVGISTGDANQMNRANLKKTMEDLTKDIERMDEVNQSGGGGGGGGGGASSNEIRFEERDPLFVANVGDYMKTASSRWIRREAV